MANAGIDQSNVAPQDGVERALLLPKDPDASAEALRAKLGATALLIIDSFGRPWRRGTTGVAIGAAGLPAMLDLRGNPDLFGRTLMVTVSAFADEIAAAASLVMGQADEAQPVVLVRGLSWKLPATRRRAGAAGDRGSVQVAPSSSLSPLPCEVERAGEGESGKLRATPPPASPARRGGT